MNDVQETTSSRSTRIKLHKPEDFEGMRKAGRLTAEALDLITPLVKPGIIIKSRAVAAASGVNG